MKSAINQVSFGEDYLFDIGRKVSFFRFKGLPEDLHLSISHDPSHRDLDFHVTRNTGGGNKKPKIVIFKIDKIIAEATINQFGPQLFHLLYEPLPIPYRQHLSKRRFAKRVRFFSLAENRNKKYWARAKSDLKKILNKTSVIKKKKRLKVAPSFLTTASEWAKNPGSQSMVRRNFKSMRWDFSNQAEAGVLFSPGFTGYVIIANGQYFVPLEEIDLRAFADMFWGAETTNLVIFKTLLAIKRVGKAISYAEISAYDQPIRLE